jgi:hypothetical protein
MCQVKPEVLPDGLSPMARRRSCGCCRWYTLKGYCPYYSKCKAKGESGYWVYSGAVEALTEARIRAMAERRSRDERLQGSDA